MCALLRVIADIAPTDIPILLVGESGSGKEALALEIHYRSRRCHEAFLKCNCANIDLDSLPMPITQPGADRLSNFGRVAAENGSGTLFLDEISHLEPHKQSRLLALLPDSDRIPSGQWLSARLISATTRNLEDEMREGRFPQELYYRINGVCLRLPSLRNRREDIPGLLAFFLKRYASLFNRREPQLGSASMDLLLRHSWPGNVRELENVARKIVALGDEQLALSDLAAGIAVVMPEAMAKLTANVPQSNVRSLKEASREASREAERTHWNRKRTARELQISYKALLYKLKQMNLDGTNGS